MKRVFAVLLSMLLLLMCVPSGVIIVSAATSGTTGDCKWLLDNNGHLTISGNGAMEDYGLKQGSSGAYSIKVPWDSAKTVTIEEGVTYIGDYSFYGCFGLKTVSLPQSVTAIGEEAFGGSQFSSIDVAEDNLYYSSRDGVLFNKDGTTLLQYPPNKGYSYTIPNDVVEIGDQAFANCNVTQVIVPDSVRSIGYAAFSCFDLTSISIGRGITNIDKMAFTGCVRLEEVLIEDLNAWCSIDFEDETANPLCLADELCIKGTKTTNLVIPIGVEIVKEYAFAGYDSLASVMIPESVKCIEERAFYDCAGLISIDVSEKNIYYSSQNGILFDKDKTVLLQYPGGKKETSYIVPDGVYTIGSSAFEHNDINSITIPDSVFTISNRAFRGCSKLTSLTIGENIITIEGSAFSGCAALRYVYYSGSKENRENIQIGYNNEILNSAYWYYNRCIHRYDHACDNTCNKCGAIRTVPDHVAADDCSETCDICGAIRLDAHSYTNECDRDCNDCNAIRVAPHLFDNACDAECNLCQAWREVPDHIYDNACDTTCNECGATRTASPHRYSNACDTTCNVCKSTREVPDHVYDNACDKYCNECNWYRVVSDHVYDNACDKSCNECGAVRQVPDHVYDTACDTDCNICGVIRQVPDHSYTDCCDADCNICGFQRTPPHDYANACDKVCDTCGRQRQVPDHIYSDAGDINCDECGYVRSAFGVPDVPRVARSTAYMVALVAHSGYEYSMDKIVWQMSPIFDGLSPNNAYSFYQRVAAKDGYAASAVSAVLKVTTPKAVAYSAPAPTLVEVTQTTVQLQQIDAFEYSKDGKTWQKSAKFTGLSLNTKYTFYQRVRATSTMAAGAAGPGLTVTTKGKEACPNIPAAPDVIFTGATKITLRELTGYEYKCGNGNWQSSPAFEGLEAETTYTFYQRIKETSTMKASAVSQGTVVQTVTYGLSTSGCHLLFQDYIRKNGTLQSNGYKAVSFTNGRYNYKLHLTADGVFCTLDYYTLQSSMEAETVISLILLPDNRYVSIHMLKDVYYQGAKLYTYDVNASIDRATYTDDTIIQTEGIEVGSQLYDEFHSAINMFLAQIGLFVMERLDMNPYYLGFFEFQDPTFEKDFCDAATGYHVGTLVLRDGYDATCEYNGYTGDYDCSHCGATQKQGTVIYAKGGHTYSDACDTSCNDCGWIRQIVHAYSNTCDSACNVCNAIRVIGHTYDNVCDANCNVCGAVREVVDHVYDDDHDLDCNLCGAVREVEDVPTVMVGDVNGDGSINNRDLVRLQQYVNEWNVEVRIDACDTNGDGNINNRDLVRLQQYVNEWDVQLG